jgi:hypothetical protein
MGSPFDINVPSSVISLDINRQTVVTFTVKNLQSRRTRAEIAIQPVPPEAPTGAWLTLLPAENAPSGSDPRFREFDTLETETISIQITVPRDVPKGLYSFRLMLSDEIEPEENFTVGPDVSFEVVEKPVEPTPPPFPMWIIPVIAVVALIIIGIIIVAVVRNNQLQADANATATADSATATALAIPTATATPVPVNLVAGNIFVNPPTPQCQQPFTVFFDIINNGTVNSPGGAVTVNIREAGGPVMFENVFTFPPMAPGGIQLAANFIVPLGNRPYTVTVTVDPGDAIKELNEGDNQNRLDFFVTGAIFFC